MALALAIALGAIAACGDDDGVDETPTAVSNTPDTVASPSAVDCAVAEAPASVRIGERQTVEGTVVGTSIAEDARGRTVLLELGGEGGGAPFAVGIPESAEPNFADPPQDVYDGARICVSGTVIEHRGVPTIFVSSPQEILNRDIDQ
jgi:hypothetical protein